MPASLPVTQGGALACSWLRLAQLPAPGLGHFQCEVSSRVHRRWALLVSLSGAVPSLPSTGATSLSLVPCWPTTCDGGQRSQGSCVP